MIDCTASPAIPCMRHSLSWQPLVVFFPQSSPTLQSGTDKYKRIPRLAAKAFGVCAIFCLFFLAGCEPRWKDEEGEIRRNAGAKSVFFCFPLNPQISWGLINKISPAFLSWHLDPVEMYLQDANCVCVPARCGAVPKSAAYHGASHGWNNCLHNGECSVPVNGGCLCLYLYLFSVGPLCALVFLREGTKPIFLWFSVSVHQSLGVSGEI